MCKCNKKELGCPITFKDYKDYTIEDIAVKKGTIRELDLNAGFISRSDIVIKLTIPSKYTSFGICNLSKNDIKFNIREAFIWHVLDEGSKIAIIDNLNFQGVEGDVELFADIQNGQIADVIVQPVHEAIRFIYPVKEILPKVNKHEMGCCDTCKGDKTHPVSRGYDECDETELIYPGTSGKFSIKLDIPESYNNEIGKFNIREGFIWHVLDTPSKLAIIDELVTNNVEGDVRLFAKIRNDNLEKIIVETKTGIEFVYPVKEIVNE